ncbi:MAG: hypothetical protein KGZ86_01565 [Candidatus Latescibacteria bacterium]|nr:hypothetical protein [Candidatus Latescibacterota bacterium]
MKNKLCLLILIIIGRSCDGPFNPFADSVGKELNPIQAGDCFVYSVQNQNSSTYDSVAWLEYTYLSDTVINNVKMYPRTRLAYYADSTVKWALTTYHAQDDFGFYNYLSTPNLQYPIPYLRYPIYIGAKWNLVSDEYFFSQYNKVDAEVLTKEDIGIYPDCWKVYTVLSNSVNETYPLYKITSWYKENIGLVKVHQEVTTTIITINLQEKNSQDN